MKRANVSLLLLLLPSIASADTVFVDCEVWSEQSKDRQTFSAALNEQSRKVTHTDSKGVSVNTEGFFTSDTIAYSYSEGEHVRITRHVEIDRTTLSVEHTFSVEIGDPRYRDDQPPDPIRSTGTCSLVEKTDRKI